MSSVNERVLAGALDDSSAWLAIKKMAVAIQRMNHRK